MKQRIFNLIILDESGSMEEIKPQAVLGVNKTLQTIKEAQQQFEEQEHLVTFVSFSSYNQIKVSYKCTPADLVSEITGRDYTPSGSTALYDAMGFSLTQLRNIVRDEDKVLVTIITDGNENSSIKYDGSDIARLVGELRERGWIFTYIGANQDVDKVADRIGIKHRLEFSATRQGTERMFKMESKCRSRCYERISKKLFDDEEDFFNKENIEEPF